MRYAVRKTEGRSLEPIYVKTQETREIILIPFINSMVIEIVGLNPAPEILATVRFRPTEDSKNKFLSHHFLFIIYVIITFKLKHTHSKFFISM